MQADRPVMVSPVEPTAAAVIAYKCDLNHVQDALLWVFNVIRTEQNVLLQLLRPRSLRFQRPVIKEQGGENPSVGSSSRAVGRRRQEASGGAKLAGSRVKTGPPGPRSPGCPCNPPRSASPELQK
ncbi:unnamed protein product [Lota lota]